MADAVARLRAEFDGDLDVGGATIASALIQRGLVDEYLLVIHPVVLGSGTPYFPKLASPIRLRQAGLRRFDSGVVLVAYRPG